MTDPGTDPGRRAIGLALLAALLFGVTTPAAKALLSVTDPWLLAGLLYLGSGIGLGTLRLMMMAVGRGSREALLRRSDLPWLAGAIVCGGGIGPVLLMFGLADGSASSGSLLLNLEGVLTALLAWLVFREHLDKRIVAGMGFITVGAFALVWKPQQGVGLDRGAVLVAMACLAWAVDNNLTRKVSSADATGIAAIKGLAAGATNIAIAAAIGAPWPGPAAAAAAGCVGLLGYGVSLALFVVALRGLGAARTGAYFSTAPFVGVAVALALGEAPGLLFWPAAALMAAGVWLHVSERHEHEHVHQPLEHDHSHVHDEHHQHSHGSWDGKEPHQHRHRHKRLVHRHPHYPDIHHQHH